MPNVWKTTLAGCGIALGLLVGGATAQAGYIFDAKFVSVDPDSNVSFRARGQDSAASQPAGRMNWTVTSPGGLPGDLANLNGQTGNNFVTFCIEVSEHVSPGSTYHFEQMTTIADNLPTAGPKLTAEKVNNLAQLWSRWQQVITALASGAGTDKYLIDGIGEYTKNVIAAALQVSIWEIVYEKSRPEEANGSGYDVYSELADKKGFKLTNLGSDGRSKVGDLANELLENTDFASGKEAKLVGFKVTTPNGGKAQDQITVEFEPPSDNVEPVPAPPALVLALAGVLPCLALRRRVRMQTA